MVILLVCLFTVLHGDITIAVDGLQNLGLIARHPGPLSREGSLSCHTYCDNGPQFLQSHSKDHPIQLQHTRG
jgi:hypothetical protein